MSSTITTRIESVQVDNAGDVRVAFGGKRANMLQITANGISNILVLLCFARANDVNVLLTLDENGNIIGATL
jgi:hypothetical protein